MQIMSNTLLMAAGLSLSLVACAETPKEVPSAPTSAAPTSIDWAGMSYGEWDKMLHISKKCPAKFDGHAERFISIRKLNESASILAISCELGAYQDGNRLYLLKGGKASPVFPVLPKSYEDWHLETQEIVWGNQYVEGEHLVLENWFAGSGECGYRALYLIADVIAQQSPTPAKVFGDINCQDETFVDDWPLIQDFK